MPWLLLHRSYTNHQPLPSESSKLIFIITTIIFIEVKQRVIIWLKPSSGNTCIVSWHTFRKANATVAGRMYKNTYPTSYSLGKMLIFTNASKYSVPHTRLSLIKQQTARLSVHLFSLYIISVFFQSTKWLSSDLWKTQALPMSSQLHAYLCSLTHMERVLSISPL